MFLMVLTRPEVSFNLKTNLWSDALIHWEVRCLKKMLNSELSALQLGGNLDKCRSWFLSDLVSVLSLQQLTCYGTL